VNRHRFDFSIRNAVGTTALAAAASPTIMFVVSSAALSREFEIGGFHSKAELHGACGVHAFRSAQGWR
jgi:hypothetical protein